MIFDKAIRGPRNEAEKTTVLNLESSSGWTTGGTLGSEQGALKLSAVNRAVACLTDSMSKLPIHIFDGATRMEIKDHPLNRLLAIRPNEAMTPSTYKKLMENNRLLGGNGYAVIWRSPRTAEPVELLPLSVTYCQPYVDSTGRLRYIVTNPRTGERRRLNPFEVIHYKAYSSDGITGVSVLTHANEVIQTARLTQQYEGKFFSQNARPSGILSVEGQLEAEARKKTREEWEKVHSGVDNAFRVAVLDSGLKYQQIGISNKDAQFVESKAVTVEDIARFFSVPVYKLFTGKQAYDSNEQNGIEYVVNTLHPIVAQCDEEDSYKLLFDREINEGMWIHRNMMAELKGDSKSRGAWYKIMRELGVFSPNDICALEDRPDVPGGDSRYASLNNIPLEYFEELSVARNKGVEK